jgi:flagellar biogenesis protein FliO
MRSRHRLAVLVAAFGVSTSSLVTLAAPAVAQNPRVLPAADLAPTLVDESDTAQRGAPEGDAPSAVAKESGASDPAVAAPAPAQVAPRSWLRQPRDSQSKTEDASSSNGWSWSGLAVVLLGGLAGGALVLRFRRGGTTPWSPPSAVRVLSTTRLSPKANLVTAEVHGRVLLLGVTDQTVSELGWLDDTAEPPGATSSNDEIGAEPGLAAPASRSAFGQVLGNVFHGAERKKEPEFRGNPNVAALIAARETRDVVSTNYTRASAGQERRNVTPRPTENDPRVETQVAGLLRRRR